MTAILPKQKHKIQIGRKTLNIYPVYRGGGSWRVRLTLEGEALGIWMPYEEKNESFRSITLETFSKVLQKYFQIIGRDQWNWVQFCEEAGIPYQDSSDRKAYGIYNSIVATYNFLRQKNLLSFFLEQV